MISLIKSISHLAKKTVDKSNSVRSKYVIILANDYAVSIVSETINKTGEETFEVAVYDADGNFAKNDMSWWREVFFFQAPNEVENIVKTASGLK